MDAADSWFIERLRTLPRRRRLEDILLDRRLRELDVSSLVGHIARLEEELAAVQARLDPPDETPPGHVLFLPTPDGYAIVESDRPPPPVGRLLMLDEGCFRVQRAGRSPFPRDRRPCLFLEASDAPS
jgi:hypothetical protein